LVFPLVDVRNVSKSFGGVRALRDVSLIVEEGSIHGWVGQNGAGKSTLGRILGGEIRPDSGEIIVGGEAIAPRSPRDALRLGIVAVQQELSLVPQLSVLDNVFLGVESASPLGLDRAGMTRSYGGVAGQLGVLIPPTTRVGNLSVAQQQQIEIIRAIVRDARLIVFDEPTAALTGDQSRLLHETMRTLQSRGTTLVYVSHLLDDVLDVCQTVTVLRDGSVVRSAPAETETTGSLIEAMLGRSLSQSFPVRKGGSSDDVVLGVENLSNPPLLRDLSLAVRAGEIVGLGGLVGSGRSESCRAIFGADRHSGEIFVEGKSVQIRSPAQAIKHGIAFLPEDRKALGLHLARPVRENISLPHLRRFSRRGHLDRRSEIRATAEMLARLGVRADAREAAATTLSGGNQQRVLFGKWLLETPKVLIADEPTRGIDVGAKRAIYELLFDLADNGIGILIVSSEFEELIGLCDRVLVLHRGVQAAELLREDLTEERLMNAAFGQTGVDPDE
jgi:simple sugar transport system ATP-binding protein/ribose transport system ATP-binding protein